MTSGHQESHGAMYQQDSWAYHQPYSQPHGQHNMSPMNEYQGFDYGPSPLPMEPAYTMSRPPPYTPAHHPLPPPLVMPQNGVWPSMLASQSNYQTPILPAAATHIQTPVSAATSHGSEMTPTSAKSTSRRKLTDEERRQMCLEAEQNPSMKQTQIGAKFNVERSTVSKILRQKDKYMKPVPKEEVPSPGKKSKVRLPDVEKTLANWARNQMKKGSPVTDEELRKQATMFAAGRSEVPMLSNASWLQHFKEKYLENTGDPSNLETPIEASPTSSSSGLVSPPMSTVDDQAPRLPLPDKMDDGFDFAHPSSHDASSKGDGILSPVSPDLARADGLAVELSGVHPSQFNFARQRSQTAPHLPEAIDLNGPALDIRVPSMPTRSSSNATFRDASVDPRQMMKRHKSVPDIHDTTVVGFAAMQPPPLPRSAEVSPISNPGSPSAQDENIRALYSIKQLLEQRPDVAEPDDYIMIGKLMEKLKLLRSPTGTPILPAGLSAMDIAASPRISKKRTIVGIST